MGLGSALGGLATALPRHARGDPSAATVPDVCVIGSGFAGVHLALRLVAAGRSVVLLEAAGGGVSTDDLMRRFRSEVSGDTPYPVAASRVIGLGGTSGHWGGILSRLQPSDYRTRSLFGIGADWPIDPAELGPYLSEAQALLSANTADPESGPPPIRPGDWTFSPVALSRRNDGPVRLVDTEIPKLRASPQARLEEGLHAVRLETRDGRRIDEVTAIDATGSLRTIRARRFVVAAGVFESPRLLLQSKSPAFPAGLGNHSDQVGRHLAVHPTYKARFPSAQLAPYRGPSYRSVSDEDRLRRAGLHAIAWQTLTRPKRAVFKALPEVMGTPSNRVTLGEPDALGLAVPNVHLDITGRDARTLGEARRVVDEVSAAYADGEREQMDELRFRMHPSGTCRMATAAEDGVVDANCKVFGVENLFVSGACVFPTSGTANPTLTVVALTLRLADHLLATGSAPAPRPARVAG